jgi:hypothetical protein
MSSAQVIRLSSGETIQVRTGVIQGIGPQGPVGPTGPVGLTGDQGPQGVPGPMGAITEFSTEVTPGAQSIGSVTPTLVSFTSVIRDQLSIVTSATNFTLPVGQYYVLCWLQISKQASINAVGSRVARFLYNGVVVGAKSSAAAPTYPTDISVSTGINVINPSQILQVQVEHDEGATLAIVTGKLWVSRIGPGAKGDQGVAGPTGAAGPVGAQGVIGPAGSVANNTTTYATLGG